MLLDHYIDAKRVLRYDPETGSREELGREQLPEGAETAFGFYTAAGDDVWGLYASPDGPILFHNAERFRLADLSSEIEVTPGERQNRFVFRQGGAVRGECAYPRAKRADWGYDSWSAEEESVDFFLWLKHQVGTPDFNVRYTRDAGE